MIVHIILLFFILECYIASKFKRQLNAIITAWVAGILIGLGVSTTAAVTIGAVTALVIYGGLALALSSLKTDGLENSPTYQDQKATQTNPDLPIPLLYGTVKTAGNKIWQNSEENDDSEQVKYIVKKIIAFAEGEITGFQDVRINDYDWKTINKYSWGYGEYFLGTNSQGLPKDQDFWRWSNMHNKTRFDEIGSMKNVAYIYVKLPLGERLSKDFNTTAVVKGRKIRVYTTPTTYTVQYSENPAWVMFDFLTSYNGRGLCLNDNGRVDDTKVAQMFDMQSFIEAAAYCDEIVYTNGVPSKRFTFNMIFDTQVSHKTLIDEIQRSCRGGLFTKNGKLQFKVDKPEAVSKVFTEADILDGSETFQTISNEERYDILKINYISPQHEWNKVQAFAEIETKGNELPKEHTINCLSVTNFQQASRLAWYYINSKRLCPYFGSFKTGFKAYDLEVGQVIEIPVILMGMQNYKVKVTSVVDNGTGTYTVNYRNYDANLYNDQLGCQEPTVIVTDLTDQYSNPADVTNFNVVQNQNLYEFVWDYNPSTTDTYEIRYGETWETGTILGKGIEVNKFTYAIQTKGLKRFWIKAFNGLNYSTNATMDVIQINDIPNMNEVISIDVLEDIQGTHYHTKSYHNTIKPILYDDLDYPTQVFNINKVTKVGSPTITDGRTPTTRYTVVGTPTITDDGIMSNMSGLDFVNVSKNINGNKIVFHVEFKIVDDIPTGMGTTLCDAEGSHSKFYAQVLNVNGNYYLRAYASDKTTGHGGFASPRDKVLQKNVGYIAVVELDLANNTETVSVYTNAGLYQTASYTFSSSLSDWTELTNTKIGNGSYSTIDLKQFSVTVDGNEVYRAWEIEEEGIASGFYAGSGETTSCIDTIKFLPGTSSWEVKGRVIYKPIVTGSNYIIYNSAGDKGVILVLNSVSVSFYVQFEGGTYNNTQAVNTSSPFAENDIIDFILSYNSTTQTYSINVNKNGEFWGTGSFTSTAILRQTDTGYVRLGARQGNAAYLRSSIDLKQFSITVDDTKVFAFTSPDYMLWHTTTDVWNDGEEYYKNGNLWGAKVYNDGYYISQVYDVYENAPAYVFADMVYSSADLANYCLLQIRTSEDNITWSEWKSASITNETFRYIQFKVIFNVFNNIPLVCTKLIASVDVPDKILNMEAEVTNANDGVTINYEFNTIPSIVATVQDSNAKYAVVPTETKTKTSAIIYIYNNSGAKTTGKLSLVLKGY